MTNKLDNLSQLFNQFGDYEIWYVKGYDPDSKKAIPGWKQWKKYSE